MITFSEHANLDEAIHRSGQNLSGKSSVGHGEEIQGHGLDNMHVFKREGHGGKHHYDFVEKEPRHGKDHQVYTYSPHSGNITRGSGGKWARQEVRSGSHAFHKGNPNKMAIPHDFKGAVKTVGAHYAAYKPKDHLGAFAEETDLVKHPFGESTEVDEAMMTADQHRAAITHHEKEMRKHPVGSKLFKHHRSRAEHHDLAAQRADLAADRRYRKSRGEDVGEAGIY